MENINYKVGDRVVRKLDKLNNTSIKWTNDSGDRLVLTVDRILLESNNIWFTPDYNGFWNADSFELYEKQSLKVEPSALFLAVKDSCRNIQGGIRFSEDEAQAAVSSLSVGETFTIYKLVAVSKISGERIVTKVRQKSIDKKDDSNYKTHRGRKNNKYTQECLDYIRTVKDSMTMKDLSKDINSRFGLHTDETKLAKTLWNKGIR